MENQPVIVIIRILDADLGVHYVPLRGTSGAPPKMDDSRSFGSFGLRPQADRRPHISPLSLARKRFAGMGKLFRNYAVDLYCTMWYNLIIRRKKEHQMDYAKEIERLAYEGTEAGVLFSELTSAVENGITRGRIAELIDSMVKCPDKKTREEIIEKTYKERNFHETRDAVAERVIKSVLGEDSLKSR